MWSNRGLDQHGGKRPAASDCVPRQPPAGSNPMNLDRARGLATPGRARRAAAGIAVLAAVLVATACTPDATSTTSATAGSAPGLQNAFVDTVRTVQPSVVEIQTSTGLGSGVIFDYAGDVVTNNHVVGNATTISVLVNGSPLPG